MSSFVETLSCHNQSWNHYFIVMKLFHVAALQKKCTTWPQLLAANQASVSIVRFASWKTRLFIIALFREFRSLFLGNAGYIMWGYILYLQSTHCKNEKLYLWWMLVVNLGNIIRSCWANRSDLVLYFHSALMQVHPCTHIHTHVCHATLMSQSRFHL